MCNQSKILQQVTNVRSVKFIVKCSWKIHFGYIDNGMDSKYTMRIIQAISCRRYMVYNSVDILGGCNRRQALPLYRPLGGCPIALPTRTHQVIHKRHETHLKLIGQQRLQNMN